MVLSTIGRLIWVPIAFIASGILAVFIVFSLGLELITRAIHSDVDMALIDVAFEMLRQMHLVASGLTLVPAVLLVIVGEVVRIRSALYYIVGGGIALAAIPLLARLGLSHDDATVASTTLWQVFATAGFAAGLLYWLLAGRKA